MKPTWFIWLFLVLAFAGFVDATYLTAQYFIGGPIPCYILTGCDVVTKSQYSHIGPVPVAVFGAGLYLALLGLTWGYLISKRPAGLRLAIRLTWIGLIASAILMFLQFFVIRALCLYCVISAIISALLFVLGRVIESRKQ